MAAGSCFELLSYYSDGEAADWALSELGIIAMSPELANDSALTYTFDIPSVKTEAMVIIQNMGLPRYLLNKASAQLAVVESTQKAILVDFKAQTLKLELQIVNKGMSDANGIQVRAVFNDATKEVSGVVKVDRIASRGSSKLSLLLHGISKVTLDTLSQSLGYSYLNEGRIGLNILFEASWDDGASQRSSWLNLPISSSSVTNEYYLALVQQPADAELAKTLGIAETMIFIVCFALLARSIHWCYTRNKPRPDPFKKTQKVLLQLDDDERLSQMCTTGVNGPDYV